MSRRRNKNIFQTRDQRFNYRFGSPAMRRRYRVRSKRRLAIAICVLLVLLLLVGIVATQLLRNDSKPADEQAAPSAATEEPAALSPVAVTARSLSAKASAAASDTNASAVPLLHTPRDTVTNLVNTRRSDWRLLLVNEWHPIPENFTLTTLTLLNGMDIDERAADDLDAMIDDCFAAGYAPEIGSAYRSTDYQQQLLDELIYSYINDGYSEEEARSKASEAIATPGTSEHECGLAVDITDRDYQELDEAQAETGTQQWLIEHSWEYGFILRYPEDKTTITGKIYEPWHYRYVGREYAKEIHEKGLCLEEYVWQVDSTDAEASAAD